MLKFDRCPHCKSEITATDIAKAEVQRQFMHTVGKLEPATYLAISKYIGLFRPEKRGLADERALKLVQETLELCANYKQLAAACEQTFDQIMAKRRTDNQFKPLKNHNYLKQVIPTLAEKYKANPAMAVKPAVTQGSTDAATAQAEHFARMGIDIAKFKANKR